jgi:hypothetical protein
MGLDLKAEITLAKERELDANEAALAGCFARPDALSDEARQRLLPFLEWCELQRVRPLPAKPVVVAAFVCALLDRRISKPRINETLWAVDALHNAASLASPVHSPIVSATMTSTIEPPRSWKKEDKEFFKTLAPFAQEIIAAREQAREKEVRRLQNETARYRRHMSDADKSDNTTTEKEIDMASKKDPGAGPYSNPQGEDPIFKRQPLPDFSMGKDISGKVDKASNTDGGFSGGLPAKGE